MDVILRPQAKEQQLEFYYTGKPCRNGNLSQRRTSNGVCQCDTCKNASAKNEAARLRYENDPEYRAKKNAAVRKSRVANKERAKEWSRKYRENNRDAVNATNNAWYNAKPEGERQEYAKSKYYKDLARTMLHNAKQRAKKNGIPFDLTIDDIIITDTCPVLGVPFEWGIGNNDFSPTVDRMIPELGYVKGNIKVISNIANRIKSNATSTQVEKVLKYLLQIENQSITP